MQMQVEADRKKRAAILESEGQRESAINRAEGMKRSQVLASEGERTQITNKALGELYVSDFIFLSIRSPWFEAGYSVDL